jgi:hypothetical protein
MADVALSSVVHPQAVVFLLPHVDVVVHHVLEPVLSPPVSWKCPSGGPEIAFSLVGFVCLAVLVGVVWLASLLAPMGKQTSQPHTLC